MTNLAPTASIPQIQQQQKEWAAENFGPECTPEQRANATLGIAEELGELAEQTKIAPIFALWFDADIHINNHQGAVLQIKDAIGDIGIYMLDVLNRHGIKFTWALSANPPACDLTDVTITVGRICHAVLKNNQQIRMEENHILTIDRNAAVLFQQLDYIGRRVNSSFLDCLHTTWSNVVSKRDWKASPENGFHQAVS